MHRIVELVGCTWRNYGLGGCLPLSGQQSLSLDSFLFVAKALIILNCQYLTAQVARHRSSDMLTDESQNRRPAFETSTIVTVE